jgi:hypothetical protein
MEREKKEKGKRRKEKEKEKSQNNESRVRLGEKDTNHFKSSSTFGELSVSLIYMVDVELNLFGLIG